MLRGICALRTAIVFGSHRCCCRCCCCRCCCWLAMVTVAVILTLIYSSTLDTSLPTCHDCYNCTTGDLASIMMRPQQHRFSNSACNDARCGGCITGKTGQCWQETVHDLLLIQEGPDILLWNSVPKTIVGMVFWDLIPEW